jgi:hypothetical protein
VPCDTLRLGSMIEPLPMRSLLPFLSLIIGTGCLHQVAQLIGDGGNAGSACDWRDAGDAGLCRDDSQCQRGFYCDFAVMGCPSGSYFGTVNPGPCLPACGITAALPDTPGAACHVGEDCAPEETCFCDATGTVQQPCSDGRCSLLFGGIGCDFPGRPVGCRGINVPHTPWLACVCSGNTCSVPEPDAGSECPIDYAPCDGGVCIYGRCQAVRYGCAGVDAGGVVCTIPKSETTTEDVCVCCSGGYQCLFACFPSCQNGASLCPYDAGTCSLLYCADLTSDRSNCGGCGISCNVDAGERCIQPSVGQLGVCTDAG